MRLSPLFVLLPLAGCLPNGEWIPTVWGGEAVDDAADPEDQGRFESGDCTVTLDRWAVSLQGGALLNAETTADAALPGDQVFDLVQPGPHSLASVFMRRGSFPQTALILGPPDSFIVSQLAGTGRLVGIDNAASDANPIRGNVSDALEEAMAAQGAVVAGTGTVSCGTEVAFSLLIPDEVGLAFCPNVEGFEVAGGSYAVTTWSSTADTVLGPFARALHDTDDEDDDGVIRWDELSEDVALGLRDAQRASWSTDAGPCAWEAVPE